MLARLDTVLELCGSVEGDHILDELKKSAFYNTLQDNPAQETGPLVFLANMAQDSFSKVLSMESEIYQLKEVNKSILLLLEQHLFNKGDNSPAECTMLNDINNIKSRHGIY